MVRVRAPSDTPEKVVLKVIDDAFRELYRAEANGKGGGDLKVKKTIRVSGPEDLPEGAFWGFKDYPDPEPLDSEDWRFKILMDLQHRRAFTESTTTLDTNASALVHQHALRTGHYYMENVGLTVKAVEFFNEFTTIDRTYEFGRKVIAYWHTLKTGEKYARSDVRSQAFDFTYEGESYQLLFIDHEYMGMTFVLHPDQEAVYRFKYALDEHLGEPHTKLSVFSNGSWAKNVALDTLIEGVDWSNIIIEASLEEQIKDAYQGFLSNRETYKELGFAWKRGILLVGPPGTGKTMICKAISNDVDIEILYIKDLEEPMNSSRQVIKNVFSYARDRAPCVMIFEDLDGFVVENLRTTFLNEMDGLEDNEGIMMLASSNHPENIDPALLNRPSRFDRVFHIGLPGFEERQRYLNYLFDKPAIAEKLAGEDLEEIAREVAQATHNFSIPYLKEAFIGATLPYLQEGGDLGERFEEQISNLKGSLKETRQPAKLVQMNGSATMGF